MKEITQEDYNNLLKEENLNIFLQKLGNDFYDDFVFAAFLEFKNRNANIKYFNNISEVPISRFNIIIGTVESTVKYLEKLGIDRPKSLNIPTQLKRMINRNVYETTLGEVRLFDNNKFPLAIKPIDKTANFIAGPVRNKSDFSNFFFNFSDDLKVQISDVVNFVSEYRCFVNEGKLVGIKHYIGDFKLFPNVTYIEECIKVFTDAPIGYTLDVGVTNTGITTLIECNDGWSIGHYGLASDIYVKLLLNRWMEILKNDLNCQ